MKEASLVVVTKGRAEGFFLALTSLHCSASFPQAPRDYFRWGVNGWHPIKQVKSWQKWPVSGQWSKEGHRQK